MTPGPTTLCTAPRRRPSLARMPRRPAGWPAGSPTRFPDSPLRGETRLIEARAAAMKGDHRAAASLLEALLKPAAGGDGAGQSPQKLPPALAQDARYELALAYRALGRIGRRRQAARDPGRRAGRAFRRRRPVPPGPGTRRGRPIRRGDPAAASATWPTTRAARSPSSPWPTWSPPSSARAAPRTPARRSRSWLASSPPARPCHVPGSGSPRPPWPPASSTAPPSNSAW